MPESKVGPGPTSNEKFNARAVRLALEDGKSASTVARERRHLAHHGEHPDLRGQRLLKRFLRGARVIPASDAEPAVIASRAPERSSCLTT